MLVDDRDDNLVLLQRVLQRRDVELLVADSAATALRLMLEHDVAVAVVDLQVPGFDGFALAELMRRTDRMRCVPIIFVTGGRHEPERMRRGYQLGGVDFMMKPLEPVIVRQKLDLLLELSIQREQLDEALRISEIFVAVIAHDLRTPLSAISFALATLRSSEDARLTALAEQLFPTAKRMADLVAQLCDLSRVRLGRGFDLSLRELDIVALVRACVAEVEVSFGARIVVQSPIAVTIVGDELRLAQAISNILGNAVRHGDPSHPIEVEVCEHDMIVGTEIRGGGVIPDEVAAELFLPFKSARRRRGEHDSLGLGLYIADQIMRAHRGGIDVTSGDGVTSVRANLPLRGPPKA